jgi:hypothetical protein
MTERVPALHCDRIPVLVATMGILFIVSICLLVALKDVDSFQSLVGTAGTKRLSSRLAGRSDDVSSTQQDSIHQHRRRKHESTADKRLRQSRLYSGYIAPEADPEYRKMVKPSLLRKPLVVGADGNATAAAVAAALEFALPLPKEGDIVLSPDGIDWPGEEKYGRIRFLREQQAPQQKQDSSTLANATAWYADIVPLAEGKSKDVFVVDKRAKSILLPIANLRPIQAFYVRAENGYKIAFEPNSTKVILRAEAYRNLTKDFVPVAKVSGKCE